jgi:hypothetical protein
VKQITRILVAALLQAPWAAMCIAETVVFDQPQCAGMSGFRAHWNLPIPVAEDGARLLTDRVVKDRGQTAVWDGAKPGPLAFDAQHRSLLVRFPNAGHKLAEALAAGKALEKVELVLPYADEEIWPPGETDFPSAEGYRFRMNWEVDALWRGVVREKTKKQSPNLAYREERPNWHAVAFALRKPWQADAVIGPTYNAAVNGAVYWKRFGATDTNEDRFPVQFAPVEVSSYKPEGRLDVTAVLNDAAFGKNLAERLRVLADCGFILSKLETYDARYSLGAYEWAMSSGPRAILIKQPRLVVTLKDGPPQKLGPVAPADVAALAQARKAKPAGAPTAVVPTKEEVARLNEQFMAKPAWMPDWQFAHVKQLMSLEGGEVQPFYYRVVPEFVVKRVHGAAAQVAKKGGTVDADYEVYLAWLDDINGRPLRYWEGHLTAANDISRWYNFRDAMPAPIQDIFVRNWTAWLMPDRETAMTDKERKNFADTSGKLIHPMADDPRVGVDATGKQAVFGQGDTYYRKTGDWRGNKSYYRSGFTRMMSTANFNSSATAGALLCGQIVGSERAMADGRAGMMQFPFWMWTYSAGAGQEYIDHYYWAIATAGNKLLGDFGGDPQDRMAGWSIVNKTVNDLAISYHPNLKKLFGPASRTYYEHVLGVQDGLYHILHVVSPRGALSDVEAGTLPALTWNEPTAKGRPPKPISAWGHDYPAQAVALNSLTGPWGEPWLSEWVDEKPLPWSALVEKQGDWVATYFGENYGLTSIRRSHQRIHVLGQWRRTAKLPASMTDIGTMDVRIGFNQTTIGNDLEGVISQQGVYRTYQHRNKLILLAQPKPGVIAERAAEHKFGQGTVPAQEIKSVQCTAALFSYEQPAPTWEIFVDDRKVPSLPATAKAGQVITIRDGVSYLAFRPLPTDNLGRDADITLEAGQPQTQPYHEQTRIQPALFIHANFYRRAAALGKGDLDKLQQARSGFVVEMGDEKEYGSFAKFQARVRQAKLSGDSKTTVTYTTDADTLEASWDSFTVNGNDPAALAKEQRLWQDTTLSQMGLARKLEKSGAVIERAEVKGVNPMILQTFPKQKTWVCINPVPGYKAYRFSTPDGVRIAADGLCSMGQWAVKNGREIAVRYAAFKLEPKYMPKPEECASLLFVSGTAGKPKVTLNDRDLSAALKPWKHDRAEGWLVPLAGAFPPDDQIAARLKSVNETISTESN